jgi:hypothetical protein
MSNCYLCGRPILDSQYHRRRKVKTGEYERRRYPNPKISAVQTTYGMRIVCAGCARMLDRQKIAKLWLEHLPVLVALAVLLLVILFSSFLR